MTVRPPAVAGTFYPETPSALIAEIEKHIVKGEAKRLALGAVAPHAGIRYSGDVAGVVYSRIEIPRRVVLLGPNHTGRGADAALVAEGYWKMPQGEVPIDADLAQQILGGASRLRADESAHAGEHALETQLPFLQYFKDGFAIVPLCLRRQSTAACEEIGLAIARAVLAVDEPVLIVASTDMSHYESHTTARRKDALAKEQIAKRDPKGLSETVRAEAISMCGLQPVMAMLFAVNHLGATRAEEAGYMTSGEINGDWDRVVGYLGMVFS